MRAADGGSSVLALVGIDAGYSMELLQGLDCCEAPGRSTRRVFVQEVTAGGGQFGVQASYELHVCGDPGVGPVDGCLVETLGVVRNSRPAMYRTQYTW